MKITKEMLADTRRKTNGPVVMMEPLTVRALLDERKALMEALRACLPVGSAAEEMRDLALLGGEDEG